MQDIEFTVEDGVLYLLRRVPASAPRERPLEIAAEMTEED